MIVFELTIMFQPSRWTKWSYHQDGLYLEIRFWCVGICIWWHDKEKANAMTLQEIFESGEES